MSVSVDTQLLNQIGLATDRSTKAKEALGQEEFLKLMTTQLQNQDPFKPMESGDFLGQIAQFGTVSGIQDLQKSFSNFAASLASNQSLQASGMLGRDVLVPSAINAVDTNLGMSGAYNVPAYANGVTVKIYSQSGQLIHSIPMGAQSQGLQRYQWDGKLPDGTQVAPAQYQVEVDANIQGKNYALEHFAESKVTSITFGGLGQELSLSLNGLGEVNFSSVMQIR